MVASASAAERCHVDVPHDGMDAEVLFRRYARNVSALLYRLGVPAQDLHDLTQEVFLVAHRKGGYLPGPAQPLTWLARIAFGIASDYRRVTRRRLQRMPDGELRVDAVDVYLLLSSFDDGSAAGEEQPSALRQDALRFVKTIDDGGSGQIGRLEEFARTVASMVGRPL